MLSLKVERLFDNNYYKLSRQYFDSQVSKDAKECMQECVSEYISFLTSEYPPTNS